jgi:hypothetical protein
VTAELDTTKDEEASAAVQEVKTFVGQARLPPRHRMTVPLFSGS